MKTKLTLHLEVTPDLPKINEKSDADYTIWTICNSNGEEYIERRLTTTNAIGYLLVPNQITNYEMELI